MYILRIILNCNVIYYVYILFLYTLALLQLSYANCLALAIINQWMNVLFYIKNDRVNIPSQCKL